MIVYKSFSCFTRYIGKSRINICYTRHGEIKQLASFVALQCLASILLLLILLLFFTMILVAGTHIFFFLLFFSLPLRFTTNGECCGLMTKRKESEKKRIVLVADVQSATSTNREQPRSSLFYTIY
jgi:ABC-type bacteriocin/lantibiotic exporter with double-glycine peptidase domain